jgi:Mg-chelatase subunit ChlD
MPLGGRLVVAACLVLALFPPPLPWMHARLDLVVLVDDSRSMPRDFLTQAWQQVVALLNQSSATTPVRLRRFAATVAPDPGPLPAAELALAQALPRNQALDGSATNIERALREVLHGLAADRPSAILLVSDGVASHGDTAAALRAASDAGVPVHLLAPPVDTTDLPLRLIDVQAPPQVVVGDLVPIRARVESARGGAVDILLETDAGLIERRQLSLAPGAVAAVSFEYAARVPGIRQLRVRVEENSDSAARAASPPGGTPAPWLAQTRAVNVLGLAPVLVVSGQSEQNPLVRGLRLAGWDVQGITPGAVIAHQSSWRQAGVIVLDDVAAPELPASAWAGLVEVVRNNGKGLLVLGGGNSFGAGAYRHSRLEEILPVTAEASRPQPPAAVMFVLDRSGSMERGQSGPSRLALARRAIAASVDMLLPGDELGIITFAADVETRLPLTTHGSATAAISAALDVDAAGGTRLAPALRAALRQLRQRDVSQRLLVLVTDGFAEDEDLTALTGQLRTEGITVIALAVGSEADHTTLRELSSFNGGRLLEVSKLASLPRLMPNELATRRAPAQAPATVPEPVRPVPFLPGSRLQWPAVSAYMVTRARPDSQVYLQSTQGEPLFASGLAGAGRVAVLPAGLGPWAQAWWDWPRFGRFLGGLLLWVGQNDSHAGLSLRVENQPGQLVYRIDQQASAESLVPGPGLLSVRGPDGRATVVSPRLEVPGRYSAVVPATATGLYVGTLHLGDRSVRQAIYRNASNEFQPAAAAQPQLQTWIGRGWLRRWKGAAAFAEEWPLEATGARQPLLLLALFTYVTVLLWERGLLVAGMRRLRSRFSR